MIYQKSIKIANKLIEKGYIDEEKKDIVAYGFFTIFSRILYGLFCFINGMLFNCFAESVIFYVVFVILKKHVGGIHAKTEMRCFIASSTSIFLSIVAISLSKTLLVKEYLLVILLLISAILIAVFAPIESQEKPLSDSEKTSYAIITRVKLLALISVAFLCYILDLKSIVYPVCSATVLVSILLIIGRIKGKEKRF